MTMNTDRKKCFNNIYDTNHWFNAVSDSGANIIQSESKSGGGSTSAQTHTISIEIPKLFSMLKISLILDAPCGDFNWMKYVKLDNIDYIGADIVDALIDDNNKLYGDKNRIFLTLDIVSDDLPKCDLIFCRDCLVHLPVKDVIDALKNFKKSGSTYLLTTTFMDSYRTNRLDMKLGDWHAINLLAYPYNLPWPMYIINENCTEGGGNFADKSLALWRLEDLDL